MSFKFPSELGQHVKSLPWYPSSQPCDVVIFRHDSEESYVETDLRVQDDSPTFSGINEDEIAGIRLKHQASGSDYRSPAELDKKIEKVINAEIKRCYVGYDVETRPIKDEENQDSAELVSHQFYLAHNGQRKSVILLSDQRFSEAAFVEFIAQAIPDDLENVYLSSHFSLIEGGWLLQSMEGTCDLKHRQGYIEDTATYAPLLACSAYLKSVVNKIFLEAHNRQAAIKRTSNPRARVGKVSRLKLTKFEEAVVHVDDSLCEINIRFIPDGIREKILKFNSPSWAFHNLCLGKEKSLDVFNWRDEIREYLHDLVLKRPIVPKRDKTWHGSLGLFSTKDLKVFEKAGIEALGAYLARFKPFQKLTTIPLSPTVPRGPLAQSTGGSGNEDLKPDEMLPIKLWVGPDECIVPSLGSKIYEPFILDPKTAKDGKKNKLIALKKAYFAEILELAERLRDEKVLPCEIDNQWFYVANRGSDNRRPKQRVEAKENFKKLPKRHLHFVDSNGYGFPALKSLGKTIGIPKIDLKDGVISDMSAYLRKNPVGFCEYAIRDSVVSAEAIPWFGRLFRIELDLPLHTRIASYSASHFKNVFRNRVYTVDRLVEAGSEIGDSGALNVKRYLGWERSESKPWYPSIQMQQFARFYAGGWNAVFSVGSLGECGYHDLKSAYPCGFLMLHYDYDFSRPKVFKGEEAHREALRMIKDKAGPFQIAGVEIAFEFKDGVEPIFPVRVHQLEVSPVLTPEGQDMILFVKSGSGNVMFPEFFTAVNMDLLKWYKVIALETYQVLPGESEFAKAVFHALDKRGKPGMKPVYKSILNYAYGKFCESINKKLVKLADKQSEKRRNPGPLTCYPIAAYATSICRAVMGELLNLGNPCYAITTDGFISPILDPEDLKTGYIANATQEKIKGLYEHITDSNGNVIKKKPYKYIELAYKAETSLFIKTRGYILQGEDENKKPMVKLARMGVQTKSKAPKDGEIDLRVIEFLEALKNKRCEKRSFPGFARLKAADADGTPQDRPPVQRLSMARVSHTYDSKRLPVGPDYPEVPFTYEGHTYLHPRFDTKPLFNKNDFVKSRKISARNMESWQYSEMFSEGADIVQPTKAKIICLCGKVSFEDDFRSKAAELTLQGNVVLMPMYFSTEEPPKDVMDRLVVIHNQKIDMCDEIFVINPDGRIGGHTGVEIEYAQAQLKPVKYLVAT